MGNLGHLHRPSKPPPVFHASPFATRAGFSNSAEAPIILQSRSVAHNQMAAGFYSAPAYIACVIVATLPITIVADAIFSTLVYWMTNFVRQVRGCSWSNIAL